MGKSKRGILMRYARLIGIAAVCATVAATLFISTRLLRAQAATPTPYNPYPPGILPSNIASELARVQREIQGIFNNYLAQSKALPPVTYTGNPPIIQGDGYQAMRVLGGLLQYDLTMSPFENRACASCHMPYAAFSGPIPSVNLTMVAYPGSYAYGQASGPRSDTPIHTHSLILTTTPPKAPSSAEISGIHVRPDINCRPLTPTNRSGLRSIRWNRSSRISLASHIGFRSRAI